MSVGHFEIQIIFLKRIDSIITCLPALYSHKAERRSTLWERLETIKIKDVRKKCLCVFFVRLSVPKARRDSSARFLSFLFLFFFFFFKRERHANEMATYKSKLLNATVDETSAC